MNRFEKLDRKRDETGGRSNITFVGPEGIALFAVCFSADGNLPDPGCGEGALSEIVPKPYSRPVGRFTAIQPDLCPNTPVWRCRKTIR
jgi:hypothetical protein